jgi:hypothetical protein
LRRTEFLLAASLLCCSALGQAVKPNFTGTWKLNNSRSTPYGPADRVYIDTIVQTDRSITVTTKSAGVTNILNGTFPISNKPHIEKMGVNYRSIKVFWENSTLVFEVRDLDSKKDTAKLLMGLRETWTLSPDGTILTKFRRTGTAAAPGKVIDEKYVFDKQ